MASTAPVPSNRRHVRPPATADKRDTTFGKEPTDASGVPLYASARRAFLAVLQLG